MSYVNNKKPSKYVPGLKIPSDWNEGGGNTKTCPGCGKLWTEDRQPAGMVFYQPPDSYRGYVCISVCSECINTLQTGSMKQQLVIDRKISQVLRSAINATINEN